MSIKRLASCGSALVAAGLFVVGCGGGTGVEKAASGSTALATTTTARASDAPVGWLAQSSDSAAFVEWFDAHGTLNGTIQISDLSGSDTNHTVSGRTLSFSGSINGSAVMMAVTGEPAWFGTLTGDSLTLNIPSADGSLVPYAFHKASIADYDQGVGVLRAAAAAANADAAAADQAKADQAAYHGALDQMNSAASSLKADVDSLAQLSYQDTLDGYVTDWATMQSDYSKEQQDDCHAVAGDAGAVAGGLSAIHAADSAVTAADDAFTQSEKAVTDDIDLLQARTAAAQAAASRVGLSVDQGQFTNLITTARASVAAAMNRTMQAHGAASTYDDEAAKLNDQAQAYASQHSC